MTRFKNERVGRVLSSNLYGDFEVIEYKGCYDVSLKFHETGHIVNKLPWGLSKKVK